MKIKAKDSDADERVSSVYKGYSKCNDKKANNQIKTKANPFELTLL